MPARQTRAEIHDSLPHVWLMTADVPPPVKDAHWTIEDIIATDDTVVTRWSGTGTHTAPLMGIPPTNRKAKVSGISVQKVRNGKISETWNTWDALGMLQQIGVVPELAAK